MAPTFSDHLKESSISKKIDNQKSKDKVTKSVILANGDGGHFYCNCESDINSSKNGAECSKGSCELIELDHSSNHYSCHTVVQDNSGSLKEGNITDSLLCEVEVGCHNQVLDSNESVNSANVKHVSCVETLNLSENKKKNDNPLFTPNTNQSLDSETNVENREKIKKESIREKKNTEHGNQSLLLKSLKCLVNAIEKLTLNSKAQDLTHLILVNLDLDQLDYDFSCFVNISDIDLSNNNLSSLPDSFRHLKKCLRLNISKNKFKSIPDVLYKDLYFIRDLDISFNFIADFNLAPLCISYLTSLNASHNNLKCPPWWLLHDIPSCLNSLNISFNPCFKERLHPKFLDLFECNQISSRVTELDISNTCFTSVNVSFLKQFVCLKVLRMNSKMYLRNYDLRNSLNELPEDIISQMPLEEIEAEDCHMACLPHYIDKLFHLRVIRVPLNNFSWLPEKIVQLDCLKVLVASNCSLIYLPKELGLLTSLTELWVAFNDISSLPDFKDCKDLRVLDLYSNSFSEMPDTLALLKLIAFDISGNYFDPSSYKQVSDGKDYEVLKSTLRSRNTYRRSDFIKVADRFRESRNSGSYSSSPKSWSSSTSSMSSRSSSFHDKEFVGGSSQLEESWDVDPDDAWDPNLYTGMRSWTSNDSLSRWRAHASHTHKENYFCPYQEQSNFRQYLPLPWSKEEEEGQYDDA